MPDPKAREVVRTPEADEPSPNEVSGFFQRAPDNQRVLTEDWVPPVSPDELDPESHVEIIPREDRDKASHMYRPVNPDFQD